MHLDFSDTNMFSSLFLDYVREHKALKSFYGLFPKIESFREQIKLKQQFSCVKREVLVQSLHKQYKASNILPDFDIDVLLDEKTFTITTGHQLNLFTGPLYFIYKIVTVINTAKQLKKRYPEYNFVPLYWMASEDHDFEEINHFNLFSKKYVWESEQKGAVGKMSPEGIMPIFDQIPESIPFIKEAYSKADTLSMAMRHIVHHLFGNQGLVVLDADDKSLKSLFQEYMKDDLLNQNAKIKVSEQTVALNESGYKDQVFPRQINLFYLTEGERNRVVKEADKYKVLNTSLEFSEEEILVHLNDSPEKFSPNVVLRPLYQETILPNLAYIGGPGELAYWLQLKTMFDFYEVPFPILLPRNFALILDKNSAKRLEKLKLNYQDIFLDHQALKNLVIEKHSEHDIGLETQKEELLKLYEDIFAKVEEVEPTMLPWVKSEEKKSQNSLNNIEKKLKKIIEKKLDINIKQIEKIKNKLFPNGSLQERQDNFLNFYLNDINFIKKLLTGFDPFLLKLSILSE